MDEIIEDLQRILSALDDAGQSMAAIKVAEAIDFLERDGAIPQANQDAKSDNEN